MKLKILTSTSHHQGKEVDQNLLYETMVDHLVINEKRNLVKRRKIKGTNDAKNIIHLLIVIRCLTVTKMTNTTKTKGIYFPCFETEAQFASAIMAPVMRTVHNIHETL